MKNSIKDFAFQTVTGELIAFMLVGEYIHEYNNGYIVNYIPNDENVKKTVFNRLMHKYQSFTNFDLLINTNQSV